MYKNLNDTLTAQQIQLVAVSKTKPNEAILSLYEQGQRHFGENRVQELLEKQEQLPKDIHWHFIGHLQTNKVKYIASFIHLIHSVDSVKILKEIQKQAKSNDRVIDVLLQIKIAEEDTKYGFDETTILDFLTTDWSNRYPNVHIVGLMGMGTFSNDPKQTRKEFQTLKKLFDRIKKDHFATVESFRERSMGMSGDYTIAAEEGSTMVRIGSLLFGQR
ncbi:MAG: YggS family pyridoxal phosphate-dependent enzyme [Saprospiraceae bacterium]